jgi:acylphosphatase
MMAKRLIIKGRVQGVRYRVTFAETAIALGLAGWVRNRRDGSVEACVHGDDDAIAAVVNWAKRGPPAARVKDVVVTESEEPMPKNKQFEILDTQ